MDSGTVSRYGYRVLNRGTKKVLAHVELVERALGRQLVGDEQVHHIDKNRLNNDPSNLVVCPDTAYHRLLHLRQEAYDASGDADYRRCRHCGKYDDQKNLRAVSASQKATFIHKSCQSERNAAQHMARMGRLNG